MHQPTTTIAPGQPRWYQLSDPIEFLTPAPLPKEDTVDLLGGAGSGKIYLFTGKGDGTFTNRVVGDGYDSVFDCNLPVGDLNNEGKLDYVFPVGAVPDDSGNGQSEIGQWTR